jgi:hypothetical protein
MGNTTGNLRTQLSVAIVCFVAAMATHVVAQDSIKTGNVPQTTAVVPAAVVLPSAAAPPLFKGLTEAAIADIENQAHLDARSDIKGSTWFLIGCLTSLTGWIIAYVVEPSPPVTRILGKSPEFVAVYTDAYKREGKKIQTSKAFAGCVTQILGVVALEAIVVVIAMSTSSYSSY